MRRLTALGLIWLPVALAAVVAIRVWGSGGAIQVGRFAAEDHHQVQNGMAGALRRLKAGDYAALLALWGLCFAY